MVRAFATGASGAGIPSREVPHGHLLYKEHLIIVVARLDEISRLWIPMADISWGIDGQRKSHVITASLQQFKDWQEAEAFMMEMAKAWIDDHR